MGILWQENLKAQISSVQNERDRLNILLSEYVGDSISIREEQIVKSRKDSLWKLADDLLEAFNLPNPALHELFINTKEMNEEGFKRLFPCYSCGIEQLNKILHQDVYKTEASVITGRRAKNIVVHKFQNLQIEKKNIRKRAISPTVMEVDNNNNTSEPPKRQYRVTSKNEQLILGPLMLYKTFPDNNITDDIIQELRNAGYTDWNLSRIRKYWLNHNIFRNSKKQK